MHKSTVVLLLVVVALLALIWSYWPGRVDPGTPQAAATTGREEQQTATTPTGSAVGAVPKVELDRLNAPKPAPEDTRRNPFRFEGGGPAPGPGAALLPPSAPPGPIVIPPPMVPPMPVGPPPIPLKFIGTVEAPRRGTKLAVLSDGRDVFYGKEGDVIDGRYRIVRIGVESIEMEYLDGRGRQTIRLTG